tara:strand:+ start:129 stop:1079 length:951 start_codon:yes stop_codon:yes gene_type:complete
MEYPYYENYVTKKEIKENFKNLQTLPSILIKPRREDCRIQMAVKTDDISKITDYFSEKCRVQCSFKNKPPPIEKFKKLQNNPIFREGGYTKIEQFLYDNARGCNNFDVKVVLSVLRYFKPKRMLDFSAGWGDRLIGAMAYGCDYDGVDPSECLHPKYQEMISTLLPPSKRGKYRMFKTGFEDFQIPSSFGNMNSKKLGKEKKYDLVFTSPPFFDLEVYENEKSQSISKFNTLEKWKQNFLIPAMEKSVSALETNGHLVIYVSDYTTESGKRIQYVRDMKRKVRELGMTYQGNVCFSNKDDLNRVRVIYVWKKLTSS